MSIPAMAILYFVLEKWLMRSIALAVSVTVVLLVFALLERHYKEGLVMSVLIGVLVFMIAFFIRC